MSEHDGTGPADRVELRGVRARGFHGVFEHERREGQDFVVDVVLGVDTRAAAATDDLERTVDYGQLALDLVAAVERDPVDLIETLAARLAAVALDRPGVAWAEIAVHKPQAPITVPFDDVVVRITRYR